MQDLHKFILLNSQQDFHFDVNWGFHVKKVVLFDSGK